MAQIYDISRTISPKLAVWPGDTPFSFEETVQIKRGESVNITRLTFTPHLGSHADAPYHYDDGGEHPSELSLEAYIGPAHVVTIKRKAGGIIPADFDGHDLTGMERLLIHTWYSDLADNQWENDFPYPTVELVDWLAEQGVVLLGVDMPSVDRFDDNTIPCHHRLYQHRILNLELLKLAGVPDGVYELVALPLKFDDICGSPVRAILRSID